jgi:hypothetical protein
MGLSLVLAGDGRKSWALLGLCEEGFVKGVPKGSYFANSATNKNKQYTLAALELLKQEQAIPGNRRIFWQRVPGTPDAMNGQLDVLFTLVKNGDYVHPVRGCFCARGRKSCGFASGGALETLFPKPRRSRSAEPRKA